MEKFIPLKPIFGMRLAASIIGFLFIVLAVISIFTQNNDKSLAELVYIFVGLLFIAIASQNIILKDKKFIKITDTNIEIKKWLLTSVINVKISDITEVKIVGSRFSIKYANTQELINLDWVSGYSRTLFANELEKLSEKHNFPYEKINILDRFKDKEL